MGPILFAHRHTMGGTPRYLPSKVLKQPRKLLLGCRSPATGFSFLILSYLVLDHFPCTFGSILSFCNHLSHLYPLEGPLKPLSSFYFFFIFPPFSSPSGSIRRLFHYFREARFDEEVQAHVNREQLINSSIN